MTEKQIVDAIHKAIEDLNELSEEAAAEGIRFKIKQFDYYEPHVGRSRFFFSSKITKEIE